MNAIYSNIEQIIGLNVVDMQLLSVTYDKPEEPNKFGTVLELSVTTQTAELLLFEKQCVHDRSVIEINDIKFRGYFKYDDRAKVLRSVLGHFVRFISAPNMTFAIGGDDPASIRVLALVRGDRSCTYYDIVSDLVSSCELDDNSARARVGQLLHYDRIRRPVSGGSHDIYDDHIATAVYDVVTRGNYPVTDPEHHQELLSMRRLHYAVTMRIFREYAPKPPWVAWSNIVGPNCTRIMRSKFEAGTPTKWRIVDMDGYFSKMYWDYLKRGKQ